MENVADKLYKYLKDKGITQRSIAETMGVTEQSVNSLIRGRRSFGRKTSMLWEKHYGLSAAWLMTGEGEMIKNQYQEPQEETEFVCKEDYNENYIELLKQQIEDKNEIIKTQSELINQLKKRLGE